jgi:hypothetical protein
LQLAGVLDQHHAVGGLGDLGQQGVDQSGLAGGCAAGDEDVLAGSHREAEDSRLFVRHDPGVDVVGEGEDRDGGSPDGEAGRGDHRRQQALEAFSGVG